MIPKPSPRILVALILVSFAPAALAKKHRKKAAPEKAAAESSAPAAINATGAAAEENAAAAENVPAAVAPEKAAAGSGPDRNVLSSFGLVAAPVGGELRVLEALPGSLADDMGFKPGDALLRLDGAEVKSAGDAAAALRAWVPHARLWAAVRRDLTIVDLESEQPKLKAPPRRSVAELTPRETVFQSRQLAAAEASAPEALRKLPTPRIDIAAGQTLWVRFPSGIPSGVKAGDVLEAETVSPVVTDAQLDYLAIPPRSAAWLQVLAAGERESASTVRLHAFKLRLAGGHTYGVDALPADVSGDQVLSRVSPGGTLVTAAADKPAAPSKGAGAAGGAGKAPPLLAPETRLKLRLLAPVALFEGPDFYRAGPGLWLRVKGAGDERALEVTEAVDGRSAAVAGLQLGDVVTAIGGGSTGRMELTDALDKLYGTPGTKVELRVKRGAGREESVTLARGEAFRPDLGLRIAPARDALSVTEVVKGSPADKAGVKAGDRIVKIGTLDASAMPAAKIGRIFEGDLVEENAVTIQRAGSADRQVQIRRGWTRVPLPPPYKP